MDLRSAASSSFHSLSNSVLMEVLSSILSLEMATYTVILITQPFNVFSKPIPVLRVNDCLRFLWL